MSCNHPARLVSLSPLAALLPLGSCNCDVGATSRAFFFFEHVDRGKSRQFDCGTISKHEQLNMLENRTAAKEAASPNPVNGDKF